MKSMNILGSVAILLAAMANPLLSGCAAEMDSAEATADDAVASNDSMAPADSAEQIGTDQQACFGGFGFPGFGFGGCGCGLGGFGFGGWGGGWGGFGGFGLGGFGGWGGFGGFGCGIC
jgi:hypothetical protein